MENETKLTPEQINSILEFAQSSAELIASGQIDFDPTSFARSYAKGYGTAYTPSMQNAIMKDLTLNPLKSTSERIEQALADAKNNEDFLISTGQQFYLTNQIYKRAVDNLSNLNAYNLLLRCVNAKSKADYKSAAFKRDYKAVKEFFAKFNYREQFNKITFMLLNNETHFVLFRDDMDDENYIFQDMPYQYCKLTSRSTHGLQYDLDFTYFMGTMANLDFYPKSVRKSYADIMKGGKDNQYDPAASVGHRNNYTALWGQLDADIHGAYAFKMNADYIANVPYLTGMFAEMALVPVFRSLETSQSMASAAKIITSQWGMLNDGKISRADSFEVNPTTMGAILGAVAASLDKAIKVVNLPSRKIDSVEFTNTNKEQYEKFNKNIASMIGGGGSSLFSTNKATTIENNIALSIDENLMANIYPQYEAFINHQLSKICKKFFFKVKLSGSNTYLNREYRTKSAFDAGQSGVVSAQKIAHAFDMDIFELEDELDFTESLGFEARLKPLLSSYTMSKEDANNKSPGREKKSDSELSESGAETRENGTNIGKGGSI